MNAAATPTFPSDVQRRHFGVHMGRYGQASKQGQGSLSECRSMRPRERNTSRPRDLARASFVSWMRSFGSMRQRLPQR